MPVSTRHGGWKRNFAVMRRGSWSSIPGRTWLEVRDRILPEVSSRPGQWVVRSLEKRGAHVHLNTGLVSARHGHVVLSTGEEFDSGLIVWTAGNAANPMVRSRRAVRPGHRFAGFGAAPHARRSSPTAS